ncbi:MAG: hypothetical protein SPL80_00650 [Bacilli bacterium]|nr:hypothetical protein [Bacilli bacterium]
MFEKAVKDKFLDASSLEETKQILIDYPDCDAEHVWNEIQNHRSKNSEKLDLDELDAVSGGADRDWKKDGCAATCEPSSWCGSNDQCFFFDVTYDNFWVCCPDGHEHECKRRCYVEAHVPDEGRYGTI